MGHDDPHLQQAIYASLQTAARGTQDPGATSRARSTTIAPTQRSYGQTAQQNRIPASRNYQRGEANRPVVAQHGRRAGHQQPHQNQPPIPGQPVKVSPRVVDPSGGVRHARQNTLQRDGMVPAKPSPAGREAVMAKRDSRLAGPATAAAPSRNSNTSGSTSSISSRGSAGRITVHTEEHAIMDAISDTEGLYGRKSASKGSSGRVSGDYQPPAPTSTSQGGWSRCLGRGTFTSTEVYAGLSEGFLESQGSPTIITYEPDAKADQAVQGGSFCLLAQFKCAHSAPASGNRPAFDLMLSIRVGGKNGAMRCTFIRVDCMDRHWTVESPDAQRQFPDRELRPGVVHSVRLEVQNGRHLKLWCDDRTVIQGLDLPESAYISGPLGLRVEASRLEWRKWKVERRESAINQHSGVAGRFESLAVGGARRATEAYSGGDAALVEAIERDVLDRNPGVTFDDIASLEKAKQTLNEAVTLPLLIPEYFTGIREPWKGVLLYGPPGTGKTLLAKAVASMNDVKFFNCSSSTLMSKWRGESEKLVKELFEMARHYAPSIIFFDEVDALMSARGGDGEHEASRRFKAELLSQMDGITSATEEGRNVMVLATSNCPWDLDEGIRRRLEKRIHVPLPDEAARHNMFSLHMRGCACDRSCDFEELARLSEGYSGADIKVVCRDASLMPMRRLVANRSPQEIVALKEAGQLDVSLSQEDFKAALAATNPSVSGSDIHKFLDWEKEFASA